MSAAEDATAAMLARINVKLREAVLASFPCAYEQYFTISIPGTVIDTTLGGSYLPEGPRVTADIRNKIQCNESILVDSMIPLDKVMLGPTGKSVQRSYMTALDMMVPRKTDIGSVDVETDYSSTGTSKYSQAMRFLRSRESLLTPDSQVLGSRIRQVKDKLEGQGVQGTVVDRYVEKQVAWSKARGDWDAVRSEALEARESRPELQSAAAFSARQKDLKRAQGVLHARWMDWVVNGDKFRVEYCFSVVDRDSVMARIERAREATRDAMITSIDGTEWPQVMLEPAHWVKICRAKAMDWATRNPSSPAHVQLRLQSLKRMRAVYQVYQTQLETRYTASKPTTTLQEARAALAEVKDEDKKTAINKLIAALGVVDEKKDALKKAEDTTPDSADPDAAAKKATEVDNRKNELAKAEAEAYRVEQENKLGGDEAAVKQELASIYKYEKEMANSKDPAEKKKAQEEYEKAKDRFLEANKRLQAGGTKGAVLQLEAGGVRTIKNNIAGHLASLNSDIAAAEAQLGAKGPDTAGAIVDIKDDKTLIRADDVPSSSAADAAKAGPEEGGADVWTKISFSVGNKSDNSSTQESNTSGSFSVSAGGWFSRVSANSSFSKSSKKFAQQMQSCQVDGSFSAMLVNIKRPWLHADLFNDFDIDLADGTKLSPGAEKIKEWVNAGDNKAGPLYRTDYGKFPAYPTSFIVAADTVLEFKTTSSESTEMMKALATDSSIQAKYGPWGLKTGASLKTDNKESAQSMQLTDGGLKISFQAPQIIGWVSEILPQLPRSSNAGGLTGPPNMAFRS